MSVLANHFGGEPAVVDMGDLCRRAQRQKTVGGWPAVSQLRFAGGRSKGWSYLNPPNRWDKVGKRLDGTFRRRRYQQVDRARGGAHRKGRAGAVEHHNADAHGGGWWLSTWITAPSWWPGLRRFSRAAP